MQYRDSSGQIKEVRCPVCHKLFIPAPMHIYRIGKQGKRI